MAAVVCGGRTPEAWRPPSRSAPGTRMHSELRERFLREGRVADRIHHAWVRYACSRRARAMLVVFLVMELLRGESLGERLKREGSLPVVRVARCPGQVLDVLHGRATGRHRARDLKPDNLFLTAGGQRQGTGFSPCARARQRSGRHRTRTGIAMHTAVHAARTGAGEALEIRWQGRSFRAGSHGVSHSGTAPRARSRQ